MLQGMYGVLFSILVKTDTVKQACQRLERSYTAIVIEKFSNLMSASIKALESLRKRDQKQFIRDMRLRYPLMISKKMNIRKIMTTLQKKCNWGMDKNEELNRILTKYVDTKTKKIRQEYNDFIVGLYEVCSLFDVYKELIKCEYSQRVDICYEVPPHIIVELKTLWEDVCTMFRLPPLNTLLRDKRYSSLIITWLIDADEETSTLIRNSFILHMSANTQFMEENNITHLIYNFEVLYPVPVSSVTFIYRVVFLVFPRQSKLQERHKVS